MFYLYKMFSIFKYFSWKNNSLQNNISLSSEEASIAQPYSIPANKTEKIQLLLQIRHIKNIYYKYTNNPLFRQELYDTFLTDTDFDYGDAAFDDNDDDNIRIFDKYIIKYIKSRELFLKNLIDMNLKYHLYLSTSKLEEHESDESHHILFIMDMTDKKIFEYCYNLYILHNKDFRVIDTLFSAIIIYNMNKTIKIFR